MYGCLHQAAPEPSFLQSARTFSPAFPAASEEELRGLEYEQAVEEGDQQCAETHDGIGDLFDEEDSAGESGAVLANASTSAEEQSSGSGLLGLGSTTDGARSSTSSTSSTPSADPRYANENDPDPFYPCVDTVNITPTISTATTHPAFYIMYLTVAWLHSHWKLPFLACNALLAIFAYIIAAAGATWGNNVQYGTLTTVLKQLGVEPAFRILPVCASCLEVHPDTLPSDAVCVRCSEVLFRRTRRLPATAGASGTTRASRPAEAPGSARPLLQFPYKSIEEQLKSLLQIPGFENELEKWRAVERHPGVYVDNFDGKICQELKGNDGRPFFENPLPPGNDELRIGLTLGIDWYAAFTYHCPLLTHLSIQVLISSQPNRAITLLVPDVLQYSQPASASEV